MKADIAEKTLASKAPFSREAIKYNIAPSFNAMENADMDVWNFKVTQAVKNLNDFVLDAKGMVNSAYTLDEYNKIFSGLEVGMGYNS